MTTLALATRSTAAMQLNWPRIGALSASLSLHLYILALLLAPAAAMQLLRRPEPEQVVHFIQKEPAVVQPEPALPTPVKPAAKHETRRPAPPEPAPTELRPTPPAIPGPPEPSGPADRGATESGPAVSADEAPTTLAYGPSTRVTYPIEAARRREHGTVVLRVLVGTDGLPQIIEIETSSGSPRLDGAARDAVKRWRFRPGTRDGRPQSAWARVPITFDLSQL